ncbi:pyruvate kinase [Pseudomonas entomophila]|uniref:pyruvate kinase n=1 Tax=Pseudomonas entomophila TaxID=312306 RepID=UPI0023D88260|nr:pyruvate kinase [Pseudomonas entomophila]MDF0731605.1 pyruvate kinase [Pseudomonas entomophila]
MHRKTKIVATIGPASASPEVFSEMLHAGLDVARLNFSHGTAEDHRRSAHMIREMSARAGREVAIMADLQGPKIRVGQFVEGRVTLNPGAPFVLCGYGVAGSTERVSLDYPELVDEVAHGDVLVLNDGAIVLDVQSVKDKQIHTTVRVGGELSNNKGINRQGGGLSAPALTPKDIRDLEVALELGADLIAVSFPKAASDMQQARALVEKFCKRAAARPKLIAKIERAEAIPALQAIIEASDGIMVARGDLGVEVGIAAVPALQKMMIKMARAANRLTITATQMMESMVTHSIPTRAEVSDVANAVLDGSDAVMLSAESATGRYPVQTIAAMAAICEEAIKLRIGLPDSELLARDLDKIDEATAVSAVFAAYRLRASAIIALTESGAAPLWMSRHTSSIPIYGLTRSVSTARWMALFQNVEPIVADAWRHHDEVIAGVEELLIRRGVVKPGDLLVVTSGKPMAPPGGTNSLQIVKVGEHAPVNSSHR